MLCALDDAAHSFLGLACFIQFHFLEIHPGCGSYLLLSSVPWYGGYHHLVNCFAAERRLDSFQLLAIVDRATINILYKFFFFFK